LLNYSRSLVRIAAENNKGDDMPTRALNDMMNGTLEVKKEVVTADSLVKEDWMDEIPFSQMNDEQKKAVEEFKIQAKAIADAAEKQKKALELELKKLRSEVNEVVKVFDEKVDNMANLRSTVLEMILTQELYCMRLGLSAMRREDLRLEISAGEAMAAQMNVTKEAIITQLAAFTAKKDEEEEKYNALNAELGEKEKMFRKQIQDVCNVPLDQDQVKMLNMLYKMKKNKGEAGSGTTSYSGNRESGGQSGSRGISRQSTAARKRSISSRRRSTSSRSRRSFGSTAEGDLGPLQAAMKEAQQLAAQGLWTSHKDPFLPADEARAKALQFNEVVVNDYVALTADDQPDNLRVGELVWDKLNELRQSRSEKEKEIALQNNCLKDAVAQMDRCKEKLAEVESSLEELEKKLEEAGERDVVERKDLEVRAQRASDAPNASERATRLTMPC
jgi:hypothetical protein